MNPVLLLAGVWVLASLMMTLGWLWQRRHANAGIVDVLWASGLGGSAILIAALGSGALWPRVLLALCGGLWGARLGAHLWRRVRAEPEDGRYRQLRQHWAGDQRRWFGLFQFQAWLIALLSMPFVIVAGNPTSRPGWLLLGAALWCVSVGGESVADRQLARFRANRANHGTTCRSGLWRYSRHPNYFFEWLHWFTYVALSIGAPAAWGSLFGPLLMFVFLRWVSGIPYTEAQALRTRGDDYRDYQQRTSMLFPWPPRPP
jgi:steroid 5-alpha reductase family enzyme